MSSAALYDRIGSTYTATRREDPRIAHAIHEALSDAYTVLNVGTGTGSYEPHDRDVVAVEPSAVMIAQRPPDAAPVVHANAEALPFEDSSFDAAMAVLSDHHWENHTAGLRELRRVARRRVVLFTWDPRYADTFWLTRDYLPAPKRLRVMPIEHTVRCLRGARVVPLAISHDCRDGFYHAFWCRPSAYLDERVRAGISVFTRLDDDEEGDALARLEADLRAGIWRSRNGALLQLTELDLGYRLVIAEL
jgi:SAM-dependent methyltransferase